MKPSSLANSKTKNSALLLTMIMVVSLLAAPAVAGVPDATSTNGIDRNPSEPEHDTVMVSQQYDSQSTNSKETINLMNGFVDDGATFYDPSGNPMPDQNGGYQTEPTIDGDQAGWEYTANGAGTKDGHMDVQADVGTDYLGNAVDDASTFVIGFKDNAPTPDSATWEADTSVTITPKTWYADNARSSGSVVTTNAKNAKLANCDVVVTGQFQNAVGCSLNGDGGIESAASTQMMAMMPGMSVPMKTNTVGFAITSNQSTQAEYFGYDLYIPHNVTIAVDGVSKTIGDGYLVDANQIVTATCKDANCEQHTISMTLPQAYNYSNTSEVYNTSIRMLATSPASGDGVVISITFGLKSEDQASCHTTDAQPCIIYDPSITFGDDSEPGIKIGQINDGGSSWCDAGWFLAKCRSTLAFDGKTSDGVDGLILDVKIPIDAIYSQSNWGGYDTSHLVINHGNGMEYCFNGEIKTYIMPNSAVGNYQTKNSLITYALKGDKYTVTTPANAYLADSTQLGSANADYCMGQNGVKQSEIELTTGNILEDLTRVSLLDSYNAGYYNVEHQMFEFTMIVTFTESSDWNSGATNKGFGVNTGESSEGAVGLRLSHDSARDPLASSSMVTRSTNSTNQTNPAFASAYSMFYYGTNPTSNPIAGVNGSQFGAPYMGLQGEQTARVPVMYVAGANDPYSTIECGLAAINGGMKSAKIEIFSKTNFDDRLGGGVNGSGIVAQTGASGSYNGWMPYGTDVNNDSKWGSGTTTGNWGGDQGLNPVDNSVTNTGDNNAVSYTGVFVNGDSYRARCTFTYESYDVGISQENVTTTTVVYEFDFDASSEAQYNTGGGSDTSTDDDEGIFEDLSWGDLLIIGIALLLIILAIYMWSMGSPINSWMDMRVGMILFGVGMLHAWVAAQYGSLGTGDLSDDWAQGIGTAGLLVMTAGLWIWANSGSNMGDRAIRYALSGLVLILLALPETLVEVFGADDDVFMDVMWEFPAYIVIQTFASAVGVALLISSAVGIFTSGGDE